MVRTVHRLYPQLYLEMGKVLASLILAQGASSNSCCSGSALKAQARRTYGQSCRPDPELLIDRGIVIGLGQ
jgi:hypothetical protein